MFRAELVQEIKYRKVVYEDYDLWLRLVAKGLLIAKLNCKCFYFRKHSGSITAKAQLDVSHFKKIAATKQYYLSKLTAAERLQPFNIKVWLAKIKDEATFQFKSLKMKRS